MTFESRVQTLTSRGVYYEESVERTEGVQDRDFGSILFYLTRNGDVSNVRSLFGFLVYLFGDFIGPGHGLPRSVSRPSLSRVHPD